MGDRDLVVVEKAGDHGRTHALTLRLGLRGVVDDFVGSVNRVTQDDAGARQAGFRVFDAQVFPHEGIANQVDDGLHGDAAGHFAGVVAAHAVGEHE